MNSITKIRHSFTSIAAAAVLASGLMTGTALAGPTDNPPTVKVSYADLNLASPAGIRTLHRRIDSAARSVCGYSDAFNRTEMEVRYAARSCYKAAMANALKQVDMSQRVAQN